MLKSAASAALRLCVRFKSGKKVGKRRPDVVQLVQLVKVTTFQAPWPSHRYLSIQKSTAEVKLTVGTMSNRDGAVSPFYKTFFYPLFLPK